MLYMNICLFSSSLCKVKFIFNVCYVSQPMSMQSSWLAHNSQSLYWWISALQIWNTSSGRYTILPNQLECLVEPFMKRRLGRAFMKNFCTVWWIFVVCDDLFCPHRENHIWLLVNLYLESDLNIFFSKIMSRICSSHLKISHENMLKIKYKLRWSDGSIS